MLVGFKNAFNNYCESFVHKIVMFVADASDRLWIYQPELENLTVSSGYKVKTRTSVDCGRRCSQNDTCISFFVMPGQELNCQLHDTLLSVSDGLSAVQASYYYVLEGGKDSIMICLGFKPYM